MDEIMWDCWDALGRAFQDLGQYGDAVRCYRIAAAAGGGADPVHREGLCLLLLGRDADAIAVLRRALDLDPTHTGARYNLAVALRGRSPAEAAAHGAVLRRFDSELADLLAPRL